MKLIKTQAEILVASSLATVGKPFKYAATEKEAPKAFDCSSLTQYLYKKAGIKIPRSTILQAHLGIKVGLRNLEVGDLLFFHGTIGHYNAEFPKGIGHVAIYIGNDTVVHATGSVGKVVTVSMKEIKKRKDLVIVKRIL